jgi:uncharacterized protein YwqG
MTHGPREAILLKPSALPVLGQCAARSFFGGLPQMPADVPWPRKDAGARSHSLTFVAQIHLDDLPSLPTSLLPRHGTLCFFLSLGAEWLDPDDIRVVYFDVPLDGCVEHHPPVQFIDEAVAPWPWVTTSELTDHPYYKYPIDFAPIESTMEPERLIAGDGEQAHAWTPERDGVWVFAWSVIEHTARAVLHQIQRAIDDESIESSIQTDTVIADAEDWLKQAAAHSALDTPEPAAQRSFTTAWFDWRTALHAPGARAPKRALDIDMCLVEAIRLTACRCAAEKISHRVPAHLKQRLEGGWNGDCVCEQSHRRVRWELNQILGYGEPVQSTPLDRIEDVLLLQIKPDLYMPWWPDSDPYGVIQCWISPADLADKRFDRVTVNFDCT